LVSLTTWKQVVRRQWLTEALKSFFIRSGLVPPHHYVTGHDLYNARIGIAEPEIYEITHIQPSGLQQLDRYPHLPNLRDPVWAVRHGCVRDLINFNSLQGMAHTPATRERAARPRADEATAAMIKDVSLLGVRVTALAVIDAAEHARRQRAHVHAVTDPALLGLLLDLPVGVPIADPLAWAETACQPVGVIARDEGSLAVTRLLVPPLEIEDIIVAAPVGREMRAIRDASLFARFAHRWIMLVRTHLPEPTVLDAKLCGVGILSASGEVILHGENPVIRQLDSWDWMLREEVYQRWLTQCSPDRAKASRVQATAAATETL
jgi:hypothetical protein